MSKRSKKRGLCIVLEGVDGCGKGKQLEMLVERLRKEYPDREFVITEEPWKQTESGRKIKRIMKDEEPVPRPIVLQRLYVDNRYEHWGLEIAPAIAEGKIVICDRERLSTYAYGRTFGVPLDTIIGWHGNLTMPDLFLYFRVSAATTVSRIDGRGETQQYFEQEQKVARIISAYNKEIALNTLPNVVTIDGEKKPGPVHDQVWAHVQQLIQEERRCKDETATPK